jgi:protein O-mannosyl-transferase
MSSVFGYDPTFELMRLLLTGFCLFLAFATFYPALSNQYAYDDEYVVVKNPLVSGSSKENSVWTSPYWNSESFSAGGLYRPLTLWSFQMTRGVRERTFFIDHAINIFLHGVVGVLVLLLLTRLQISARTAWLLTALYLCHPVHTEVVASLVGRADLMSSVFFLAVLNLGLATKANSFLRVAFLFFLTFCALASKESSICVAVILPCLLVFTKPQDSRRIFWSQCASVWTAVAIYLAIRLQVLHHLTIPEAGAAELGDSFLEQRWASLAYFSFYFQKFLFPYPLLPDYQSGILDFHSISFHARAATGLCLILFPFMYMLSKRSVTAPIFFYLLFLVSVFPVSSVVFPIGSPFAERFLYLPSIFLMPLVGTLLGPTLRPRVSRFLGLLIPFVAVLGATIAAAHSRYWHDSIALFSRAVQDVPGSFYFHLHLGTKQMELGNSTEASREFHAAIRLRPEKHEPYLGLGAMAFNSQHFDEAEKWYSTALARGNFKSHHESLYNLFHVYRITRQKEKALASMERALFIRPDFVLGRRAYAKYLSELREYRKAIAQFDLLIRQGASSSEDWQALIALYVYDKNQVAALQKWSLAPASARTPEFESWLRKQGVNVKR